ncbi:type 1 glutamine amidotransferase [Yoonia sp. R2331]|uniref:type 1 glutamine amidotransferase n=1 Tax=Yoonia sp. R2331 TaxID=3237238 RepID=UPI0034E5CC44
MKIGVLVAGVLPEKLSQRFAGYGEMYAALLGGLGYTFRHYDVRNGDFPAAADEADAWLITGSKNGVYEDEPWIKTLKTCLSDILKSDRPVVGICFGHQILADVLGGRVAKFDGGWTVGRTRYCLRQGTTLHAIAWHQDQVLALPPGAVRLASSDSCENAMMMVGGHVLGIQPHPEFDAAIMRIALDAYGDILPADLSQAARATAHEPVARDALVAMIDTFLRSKVRAPDQLQQKVLQAMSRSEAA